MGCVNSAVRLCAGVWLASIWGCAGQSTRKSVGNEAAPREAEASISPDLLPVPAPSAARPSVPTFVVSGAGAWTATSCDLGAHWVVSERSPDHDDHGPFSNMPGVLADRGIFLLATGWGAPGHVYASQDGVDWSAPPADAFRRQGTQVPLTFHSGLVRSANRFLLFGGASFQSTDGRAWISWEPVLPSYVDQLRLVRAFPERGLILLSAENQRHEAHALGHFPLVSRDGGHSFVEGTGLAQACGGGSASAFFEDKLFLANQALCSSGDLGATWGELSFPTDAEITSLFSDGKTLFAIAGQTLYARNAERGFEALFDAGVKLRLGGFGEGTYVLAAERGPQFFYSSDLSTWKEGEVMNPIPNANLRGFAFGYGAPSVRCPRRSEP